MLNIKSEIEKSTPHIIVQIIEYVPNSIVTRTIIKKASGNVTVCSVDAGEELSEKSIPYDNFIQVIDGRAELAVKNKTYSLGLGEGMIIPAHAIHSFTATQQFKMISTVIKSGYED